MFLLKTLPCSYANCNKFQTQKIIHDYGTTSTETLVNNDSVTVGHIPKFMSKLTYFFLKHGGHAKCRITGDKKYLEQGGHDIPARLTFSNTNKKRQMP